MQEINPVVIQQLIDSKVTTNIILFEVLPSTNEYIFEQLANPELKNNSVVLALTQTAGKGRQGRNWISPPGNIYMSYYWQFHGTLEKLYGLSLTVGIAIARVLKANGLEDVKLKWPNDIFWNGYKMGGILIETKTKSPGIIDVVIGLGLNIQNMSDWHNQISQRYVELENALQHPVYKNKLIAQIIVELQQILTQFAANGFESFVNEWKQYDIQQGSSLDSCVHRNAT
jgi:BirA family transcriptional regulator, biotin operon repressor / biotin---[acetyl-CoA-carboxylase] ligase